MKKTTFIFLMTLLIVECVHSQTNVTFVNTGQMYVAPQSSSAGVSLYVPDAMRQLTVSGRTVGIIQNGITELGGNFYQDALSTVFVVDQTTNTTSTGKFRFVKDTGTNRTITTQSVNINAFDRGSYYIAFPNIEISTNDSIAVPGKMGIDALSLHRVNSKTGKLILRSDVVNSKSYDASLRVNQAGTSSSLVDLGAVIVERDMTIYRPSNGSTQLFGFATPFKDTQLSGYFAGNWVRRPLNTGTYGHTTYIYGNKDNSPADAIIDQDQYVYLAAEKLVPAQAYLIKPRPNAYAYSNLQAESGLWYTGEPNPSLYDKGKYYFNGKVYTVTPYSEQLFAEDVLFSGSINTASLGSTVNWLIGNSYTCPLPISLLSDAIGNSNLVFSPYIYVYPAGSSTYQAVDISNPDAIIVSGVTEIPAMSVFMVRVSKGTAQNGSISIGKNMLRHASVAHNNPNNVSGKAKAETSTSNQVTFKVSPVGNDNIYDYTAIGLRASALYGMDNYDMLKAYVDDNNIFQLYTLSGTNKLSANGLPLNADSIVMAFNPSKYAGDYNLTSQYVETLSSEGLWIFDKKTQDLVDMKTVGNYTFSAEPTDNTDRFLVMFSNPVKTGINNTSFKLHLYCHDKKLFVKQLTGYDLGSKITVYDLHGKQLHTCLVNNYPEMSIDLSDINSGVYIVQIRGMQTATAKFIIN
ncbi:MAG: T9SS type A sorting domain-containing protein [Paludibacter sp.]